MQLDTRNERLEPNGVRVVSVAVGPTIAIHSMLLRERSEPVADAAPPSAPPMPAPVRAPGPAARRDKGPAREVAYYAADECILVDGEYLIRSLPAKIFWKLLNALQRGRFALQFGSDVVLVQKP